MEEEIVIMAHHLEEEAAEVPCEEVCLFFWFHVKKNIYSICFINWFHEIFERKFLLFDFTKFFSLDIFIYWLFTFFRFRIWRPTRRRGWRLWKQPFCPLFCWWRWPWWQRKNVKNFKKISRQKSPAIDNYHIGFHEMDKNKNKKIILKQLYLKIIHVNTLSYVIYYTIDFKNTVLCTYNYDF